MTGAGSQDGVGSLIDAYDALLEETARREHRFWWLRDPDSEDGTEWLSVDAYYPRNRLVVVFGRTDATLAACRELIPAYGLVPLLLQPEELTAECTDDSALLREWLETAGWSARADAHPSATAGPPPLPLQSQSGSPIARTAPAHTIAGPTLAYGLQIGVVLILVALAETYLGVDILAVHHGQPVLGIGFVLDACCRIAGTIACGQRGDLGGALTALVVGSPDLAFRGEAGVATDDATRGPGLAVTLARAALVTLVLGVLLAAVGL